MIAPIEAIARIPDSLDPAEAAPLLCAGVTTYNALRHIGALPGDLVAVAGHSRPGPPGDPIRQQVRLSRGRSWPRLGKCLTSPKT